MPPTRLGVGPGVRVGQTYPYAVPVPVPVPLPLPLPLATNQTAGRSPFIATSSLAELYRRSPLREDSWDCLKLGNARCTDAASPRAICHEEARLHLPYISLYLPCISPPPAPSATRRRASPSP